MTLRSVKDSCLSIYVGSWMGSDLGWLFPSTTPAAAGTLHSSGDQVTVCSSADPVCCRSLRPEVFNNFEVFCSRVSCLGFLPSPLHVVNQFVEQEVVGINFRRNWQLYCLSMADCVYPYVKPSSTELTLCTPAANCLIVNILLMDGLHSYSAKSWTRTP